MEGNGDDDIYGDGCGRYLLQVSDHHAFELETNCFCYFC